MTPLHPLPTVVAGLFEQGVEKDIPPKGESQREHLGAQYRRQDCKNHHCSCGPRPGRHRDRSRSYSHRSSSHWRGTSSPQVQDQAHHRRLPREAHNLSLLGSTTPARQVGLKGTISLHLKGKSPPPTNQTETTSKVVLDYCLPLPLQLYTDEAVGDSEGETTPLGGRLVGVRKDLERTLSVTGDVLQSEDTGEPSSLFLFRASCTHC